MYNNIKIPNYVQIALILLKIASYESFLVGGCVRDMLMGKIPNDYDITTNALPLQIKEVFKDYRTIDIGEKHGTIAVIIEDTQVEITTYRIDGEYSDSRHPKTVVFTSNIMDDLSRRDFTINAIALNWQLPPFDKPLSQIDYAEIPINYFDNWNGKKDIENKVIKCVGNPLTRFEEDALRIMRALRFAAVLGFTIENNTKSAMFKCKENLNKISAERLRSEFEKMLCGDNILNVLLEYKEIIAVFIPEIRACFGFEQCTRYHIYDVWEHIARTVAAVKNDKILRLTMFFHDIAKPVIFTTDHNGDRHFFGHAEKGAEITRHILTRLKYDKKTLKTVCILVQYHDHNNSNIADKKIIKRLMALFGINNFFRIIEIKKADSKSKNLLAMNTYVNAEKAFVLAEEILRNNEVISVKQLDIKGDELAELGFRGEKISGMLNLLLHMVIDGVVENSNENLRQYVLKFL